MALFQHEAPELTENPLPAALPGEVIPVTKLHSLRLRQLVDLAQAYGIDLPPDATKNEILPIMATHERAGAFRVPPRSQYHRLRAEISHDQKLEARDRAERERRIAAAAARESDKPAPVKTAAPSVDRAEPPRPALKPPKQQTELNMLRQRAKALGINSFAKGTDALRAEIAAEESRRAGVVAQPVE